MINFPNSPTLNQTFTVGNKTWAWDGTVWNSVASAVSSNNFVTRNYVGDGSTTNFTVSQGSTVNTVIVTENGVVQQPTTDYTISGTTLTFTTATANGVAIQIRELAGSTSVVGTTTGKAIAMSIVFGG